MIDWKAAILAAVQGGCAAEQPKALDCGEDHRF
jgi:hypothetical protein